MEKKIHPNLYRIDIFPGKKAVTADENDLLADRIQEAGIPLSLYCGKKGLCGKCFVEIIKGKRPPVEEREDFFIKQKGLNRKHRLACLFRIKSDLEIRIPEESIIQEISILQTGERTPVLLDPQIKKYHLQLRKPQIALPSSFLEMVENAFQKKLRVPLAVLRKFPAIAEQNHYQITAVMDSDDQVLDIEPGDTSKENFGIAIDAGTTTLVVELVDLVTGKTLDTLTARNDQIQYGSDVMSRIGFAIKDSRNLAELKKSILNALNGMIGQILDKKEIDKANVYEIVIAGNPPMNHFLLGLPVESLARAPYLSVFSCLPELTSDELGFRINERGKVYVSPNIKSFVGGDISAGLAAVDLANKKGNFLFIDLGTNGEIVLKKQDTFMATSTAAGPAFEGMNISCGMLALPGAIHRVEDRDQIVIHTLGEKPALGICGTGLIDLIAIFLERGMVSVRGRIKNKSKRIRITGNLTITQKDIREIQLAIAAIKSGIRMILMKNNLKLDQLDGIFIAGAFGNYLNIRNSIRIGLLPPLDDEKIHFVGNSSLAGAKAFLLSRPAREKIESLVKTIRFFSLAADPMFQDYFIEALEFKEQSLSG